MKPTLIVPNTGGGALVNARVIATKACKLVGVVVLNTNAAAQYVQVHESATAPAEGAVPKLPAIRVGATSTTMFMVGEYGVDLDACYICNSSTAASKTLGAADCAIAAVLAG